MQKNNYVGFDDVLNTLDEIFVTYGGSQNSSTQDTPTVNPQEPKPADVKIDDSNSAKDNATSTSTTNTTTTTTDNSINSDAKDKDFFGMVKSTVNENKTWFIVGGVITVLAIVFIILKFQRII